MGYKNTRVERGMRVDNRVLFWIVDAQPVFPIKSNNWEDKASLQYRENLVRKWFIKLRNVITRDFNGERAASNEFFIRCGMDRPRRKGGFSLNL